MDSINHPDFTKIIDQFATPSVKSIAVDGQNIRLPVPFPSPIDWRDKWIYFLMVDRFNHPSNPPKYEYNAQVGDFQGGTFEGVRQKLGYLQDLGVGALWLTPVLKNCAYLLDTFHGYGIQDFLSIEPRLASDPQNAELELKRLIDEAHARGMYVIFDIVLNHAGDVFAYKTGPDQYRSSADHSPAGYEIAWRNAQGEAEERWFEAPHDDDPELNRDAAVWPKELRQNSVFRRIGKGGEGGGDFESLKELVTKIPRVRTTLIKIFQFLIANYDIDGLRIDTLKYIERDFARIFGNAIREYALSIGKKNFFTFGEVYDDEHKIAQFIGRHATDPGDLTGVDAALDFPLFFNLPGVVKGFKPPTDLQSVFSLRKEVQKGIISSHGDASRFFVSFLDNHDQKQRIFYRDPNDPARFEPQVSLAMAVLFTLQGIPCMYYGTEQGLHGQGDSDRAVREALWGKPDAFNQKHEFYKMTQLLSEIRMNQPELRYGRQYFRPISGDRIHFGLSFHHPGIIAFSRILNDRETLIVANCHSERSFSLYVLVDNQLNSPGDQSKLVFSNNDSSEPPSVVNGITNGIIDGHHASLCAVKVHLAPMEVQVIAVTA